eukprot:COSAG06_NODE_41103_length_395_cov_0.601351_1_plen_108_part_10
MSQGQKHLSAREKIATVRKSYDRDSSRDARARPAPPPGALERPQKGPTGAGINTVSLCVSQARPVWWRDAGRAGRLERGSEPHATGAQKVAATRRVADDLGRVGTGDV